MKWEIVNVVVTTNIKNPIDINAAATLSLRSSRLQVFYNPERFPGLIIRYGDERRGNRKAVLMFSTGKIVVVGSKSVEEALGTIREILTIFRPVFKRLPQSLTATVENLVARGSLERRISLDELAPKLPNAFYDPDVFPGLIFRPGRGSPVVLMFSTGNIVVVGAKTEEKIKEVFDQVAKLVSEQAEP